MKFLKFDKSDKYTYLPTLFKQQFHFLFLKKNDKSKFSIMLSISHQPNEPQIYRVDMYIN